MEPRVEYDGEDPVRLTIAVRGEPAAKGSVSAFPVKRKSGKLGTVVTHSQRSKHWETLVRDQLPEGVRITGAVAVYIRFWLSRPPSVKRRYPEVRPDLDKLIRATWDALTGCLEDDSRVVKSTETKEYATENRGPGALIVVEKVT